MRSKSRPELVGYKKSALLGEGRLEGELKSENPIFKIVFSPIFTLVLIMQSLITPKLSFFAAAAGAAEK